MCNNDENDVSGGSINLNMVGTTEKKLMYLYTYTTKQWRRTTHKPQTFRNFQSLLFIFFNVASALLCTHWLVVITHLMGKF